MTRPRHIALHEAGHIAMACWHRIRVSAELSESTGTVYYPIIRDGVRIDLQLAGSIALAMACCTSLDGMTVEELCLTHGGDHDLEDIRATVARRCRKLGSDADDLLRRAIARVQSVLDRHWGSVETTTTDLMERGALTADEIALDWNAWTLCIPAVSRLKRFML